MNANKLHRVFKHLNPRTQARLVAEGYEPRRGGANKLTYEDLCLIDELEATALPPPVPVVEPLEEVPKRVLTELLLGVSRTVPEDPPTAKVLPLKGKN